VADVSDRLEGLVLVTGMDITERLRLEDEKERERAFLNAIANTAPSLLCLIDDQGVMTDGDLKAIYEYLRSIPRLEGLGPRDP
jgi:PAS domain-containing protein